MDKLHPELDEGDSKKYEVEAIYNSIIYSNKSKNHLSGFYYLVLWKNYLEEENNWEPALLVLHLCKIISIFFYNH